MLPSSSKYTEKRKDKDIDDDKGYDKDEGNDDEMKATMMTKT